MWNGQNKGPCETSRSLSSPRAKKSVNFYILGGEFFLWGGTFFLGGGVKKCGEWSRMKGLISLMSLRKP